jgi:3-oxoacyl-(acyl-carrier-protein) synthase
VVQAKGLRKVSPFMIPNMLVDSPGGKIAIEHNLQGPNHAVVSACASGTSASGEAFEILRRGDADVMLAGGAEAALMPDQRLRLRRDGRAQHSAWAILPAPVAPSTATATAS